MKSCDFLSAAGRRTELFHLIFTEPGFRGLADSCRSGVGHRASIVAIPVSISIIILSFQFDNFSVALRVREAAGGTEERAVRQRARGEGGAQGDGRRLQPPGLRRRPAQGTVSLMPRPNLISVKVPANGH